MSEEIKRPFYRTSFTVEVLSDHDVSDLNLHEIAYEITDGDSSGVFHLTGIEYLSKSEVAMALIAQGSDPAFLLGEE